MTRKITTAVAAVFLNALLWVSGALAQSSPGLVTGQVPTAAQWNSYFAAKQDYLGFTPLNTTSVVGSTPIVATIGGGVVTIGCPTCVTSLSLATANLFVGNASNVAGAKTPTQLSTFYATAYGALCDGSTDDTTAIQLAITAAGNNRVILPGGTCVINTSGTGLAISAATWLVGAGTGGGRGSTVHPLAGTRLLCGGSGTMITMEPPSAGPKIMGGGIVDLALDGNALCATGLSAKSVENADFKLDVSNFSTVGMLTGVVATLSNGDNRYFVRNRIWLTFNQAFANGVALKMTSSASASSIYNEIPMLSGTYSNGIVLDIEGGDSNEFGLVGLFQQPGGTALYGVALRAGATALQTGSYNHFRRIVTGSTTAGMLVEGTNVAAVAANFNVVDVYDTVDSEPLPSLGTGVKFTYCLNSNLNCVFGASVSATQLTSTVSTGTAPLVVASTTLVANLHAATADAAPVSGLTGLGTGVATALGVNVGSAGAFVTFNGAGGTPSSITLTNGTGLPTTGLTGTLQAAQEPAHTGDVTNSAGSLALTIANNAVTLAKLATQATNTVLGNATSGTAVPTALSMTSCSTAASAVIWTTNTGFGCNTSITAAAVPVGGITGLGTGVGTWLATPSSANLASAITDETGSGALVFGTSPTFTTQITAPLHIGGIGTGSSLSLQSTSGVGATDFVRVLVGNAGGTEALRVLNNGHVSIGLTSDNGRLAINEGVAGQTLMGGTGVGANFLVDFNGSGATYFDGATMHWRQQAAPNTEGMLYTAPVAASLAAGGLSIAHTTASASKTTGALIVGGGLGVAGKVFSDTLNIATVANAATTAALCWNSGTGLVTENGAVGTCTVSLLSAKDLIRPLTNQEGFDIVMAMEPWRYTMKEGQPTWIAGEQIGFVADYADKIAIAQPVVARNHDGSLGGFRYEQYTAAITSAIKYLKADNDNLRAEINKLKRKVAR